MAMSVSKGTSSQGRRADNASVERVSFSWTAASTGVASDTFHLAGEIRELITVPSSGASKPNDNYSLRLRDTEDSSIDYFNGRFVQALDSDNVELFSDLSYFVAGDCQVHVSDAGDSNSGEAILFVRT